MSAIDISDLKIAGIHRSSTIDFPQKIAFVVFTQGCNLRCPWCRQGRLVPNQITPCEQGFNAEKCLEFIRARKEQIDGVVVTGGEPLLHDSLPGFLAAIKGLGLSIKLDTNGTLPHRLERIIAEDLVDYVALDIKAPPSNHGAYCFASGGAVDTSRVLDSVDLVNERAKAGEYRTTVLPGFHDHATLSQIVSELPPTVPYFLQLFVPELARSGQWSGQRRWSRERMENIATRLALDFPGRMIQARA